MKIVFQRISKNFITDDRVYSWGIIAKKLVFLNRNFRKARKAQKIISFSNYYNKQFTRQKWVILWRLSHVTSTTQHMHFQWLNYETWTMRSLHEESTDVTWFRSVPSGCPVEKGSSGQCRTPNPSNIQDQHMYKDVTHSCAEKVFHVKFQLLIKDDFWTCLIITS